MITTFTAKEKYRCVLRIIRQYPYSAAIATDLVEMALKWDQEENEAILIELLMENPR